MNESIYNKENTFTDLNDVLNKIIDYFSFNMVQKEFMYKEMLKEIQKFKIVFVQNIFQILSEEKNKEIIMIIEIIIKKINIKF